MAYFRSFVRYIPNSFPRDFFSFPRNLFFFPRDFENVRQNRENFPQNLRKVGENQEKVGEYRGKLQKFPKKEWEKREKQQMFFLECPKIWTKMACRFNTKPAI